MDRFENCEEQILGRCFMYLIPWHFLFWSFGRSVLSQEEHLNFYQEELGPTSNSISPGIEQTSNSANSPTKDNFDLKMSWSQTILQASKNPCMMCIPLSLGIGLFEPLREDMFEDSSVFRPVGSSIESISDLLVATTTIVSAASLFVEGNCFVYTVYIFDICSQNLIMLYIYMTLTLNITNRQTNF